MKIELPHTFSQEEAVNRIRALTDYWKKYNVQTDWQENVAHICGEVREVKFEGDLQVDGQRLTGAVEVKGNLIVRKLGEAYVMRKFNEYLNPNQSQEALKTQE
jgi:hypothetical protein